MSATTTQLFCSGAFCKLLYDTIPVKSASANVSFCKSNSKMPNLGCNTLVANERYVKRRDNIIQDESLARGPKLLFIKNYVIEIIT